MKLELKLNKETLKVLSEEQEELVQGAMRKETNRSCDAEGCYSVYCNYY